jgi:uncharacterized protein
VDARRSTIRAGHSKRCARTHIRVVIIPGRLAVRPVVRFALALVTAAAAVAPAARGQSASTSDPEKVRLIRQLIAKAHLTDQALSAIEQQMPAQRASNPRVPEVFWDRFLEQARARRGELEEGYVTLYERNFTTPELRELIAFYDSPIGKRFLEVQPTLMREGIALGQEWGTRIGADVGRALSAEGVKAGP